MAEFPRDGQGMGPGGSDDGQGCDSPGEFVCGDVNVSERVDWSAFGTFVARFPRASTTTIPNCIE